MVDTQFNSFEFTAKNGSKRKLAYQKIANKSDKPDIMWLSGFRSDMASTKVSLLTDWAVHNGYGMLRFDYSAHGLSDGDFQDGTISSWLEDAVEIFSHQITRPCILVGSSMGGWLSLLIAKKWAEQESASLAKICGLVLIAPAWDFTEDLMWERFDDATRAELQSKGVYYRPSDYDDTPYPITYNLIEDGRAHLLKNTKIPMQRSGQYPVRILQGMQDPDVPWQRAVELVDMFECTDIVLHMIKDAEHRLSRPQDIERLFVAVEEVAKAGYASS